MVHVRRQQQAVVVMLCCWALLATAARGNCRDECIAGCRGGAVICYLSCNLLPLLQQRLPRRSRHLHHEHGGATGESARPSITFTGSSITLGLHAQGSQARQSLK
uniref:Secreted protein n=1 Tax=Oryza brachyantha TaxID=4533 RepID=J3LV14_ORYBR